MNHTFPLALALSAILSGCATLPVHRDAEIAATRTPLVHEAQATTLDLKVGDETYPGVIRLPLEEDRTDVNLGAGNDPIPVCLVEGQRETCLMLRPDEPQDVVVRYLGEAKTLVLSYLGQQASFSPEYQTAHRGTLDIEVPIAYELVNVAIALTPYARENPDLSAQSPYLDEVRTRFADWADHPFVLALDQTMREEGSGYHTLKMNGAAFELSDNNTLSRSAIYRSTGWGRNTLLPVMGEMQDFARVSEFASFYASHRPLYEMQIAYLRNDVDVNAMIAWLGKEFPDVAPYDHTRILFSPLVGYNQSLKTFEVDGFRQMMPHVNFPYPEEEDAELSADALKLYRGLILFTELNHGYINPTIETYGAAIHEAMPDLSVWAGNETAQSYGSSVNVFTEMMNWALISVRAYDVLSATEAAQIAVRVERIMTDNRGFTRFPEFQERLLELSRRRGDDVPVASVFSKLIEQLPDMASD